MPFSFWIFWEGVSCPYFSSINYLAHKATYEQLLLWLCLFVEQSCSLKWFIQKPWSIQSRMCDSLCKQQHLEGESRHLRVIEVKWKPFWLHGVCMCVFSPFPSFPHFHKLPVYIGERSTSPRGKPCQKYALQKSSVLSAAYSILALQFLRVSIAFLTTFFYHNMPMCRYYSKTELFCPFSTTRPRNFRERGS